MFPTIRDLDFWTERYCPRWGRALVVHLAVTSLRPRTTIDDVVNAHAGLRPRGRECEVANLLVMLHSRRRRARPNVRAQQAAMVEMLRDLTMADPQSRAARARRWLRRMGVTQ